ncbi:MAG TPA: CPBP family intramembrane glutamic endopeptidase [Steroidobacteraceae bacterium]
MPLLLFFGLFLALFGWPLLLVAFRQLSVDLLSPAIRLCHWLLCLVVVVIAARGSELWVRQLCFHIPTAKTILGAASAVVATLAAWPVIKFIQMRLGDVPVEQSALFFKVINLTVPNRLFIAVTAGVVEEVIYRGYAIGLGRQILGSLWLAALVSLVVFTGAHFRWGVSHLLSAFWAGLVLSVLFVFSQDLIACILAHIAIDVLGIIIAPAILAKRHARIVASSIGGS